MRDLNCTGGVSVIVSKYEYLQHEQSLHKELLFCIQLGIDWTLSSSSCVAVEEGQWMTHFHPLLRL